ncbi:Mce family protein [Gordonia araii NBRC 100433]|uniref:Mce family protein n=1 Tax=Gordonia araii NBRC 100433 TaxID=1073574 RepID=G7H5N7_9ACTN|nr:MCE family protein [Gordonia araii]NNG95874.1 MCE family protein [Gordonia araii NBRC 100433]GAB11162.1 Mce family protein [Gordonia araii NBRC 100433]
MTVMLPGKSVSRARYAARAILAALLILAFSLWMVSRSTGVLDSDPKVYAEIPASAGLIQSGAPVRFHGVKVGEISSIDAGSASSRVGLTIDGAAMGSIPATVMLRVLPRTFFGDIYVQLAPIPGSPQTHVAAPLTPGAQIAVDDGPDAINLYNIFSKLSELIAEVKPDEMNVALAAVDKAIGGRGEQLGMMIDDWWTASKEMESTINRFIDATPQFARVTESLKRATPAMMETLSSVANISRGVIDTGDQIAEFFVSASGYLGSVGPFVAKNRKNLITVVDSTGTILGTVADNPTGITRTVREASKFGKAGTILFASGRFNITAVPTFSQPQPYSAADCPTYGSMRGAKCFGKRSLWGTGPVRAPGQRNGTILHPPKPRMRPAGFTDSGVIDGAGEASALRGLEAVITGQRHRPASGNPNAATTMMLGPMVRGTEVRVR